MKAVVFVIANFSDDKDYGKSTINLSVSGFFMHISWFDCCAISACCCFGKVSVFVCMLIEQAYQTSTQRF